jgi:hypothetical protein
MDYTPESMCIGHLTDQEWLVVDKAGAEARFHHIISRSLEKLDGFSGSREEDFERFIHLKNSLLEVFTSDVVFLVNRDPDGHTPAIVGMDGNTTGIFFLES